MTTSWAHLIRGEAAGAFRANVGGALLGIAALVAAPWLLASAIRGRWCVWEPASAPIAWAASAVLIVTLVDWLVRILT